MYDPSVFSASPVLSRTAWSKDGKVGEKALFMSIGNTAKVPCLRNMVLSFILMLMTPKHWHVKSLIKATPPRSAETNLTGVWKVFFQLS